MEEKESKNFLEFLAEAFRVHRGTFIFFLAGFSVFVVFGFYALLFPARVPQEYFLSVGEGDSELVVLPGNAAFLIDGGPPNGQVISELGKIFPFQKRTIEAIFLSHPELDHFGGLIEIVKRFDVGVLVTNGDGNDTDAWREFMSLVNQKNIMHVVLRSGDAVRYGAYSFSVLSPSDSVSYKARNERTLVLAFEDGVHTSLFMGDLPDTVEKTIAAILPASDILKVGHHGSKYSTSEALLLQVRPQAGFIEVGKNSYGHPTPETLSRLQKFGVQVFRTDKQNTLRAVFEGEKLKVFSLE